jgi:uncharacterized membrane protein
MMRYPKVRNAALLIGAGLGALAEGILLRHIWQWHQMADGWLLAAAWTATLAGVLTLWRAMRGPGRLPQTRTPLGFFLVGCGGFVLVEGIVVHHLLELHHVRDFPVHVAFYDWLYIILGGALVLLGLALRDGTDRAPAPLGDRRSGRDRRLAF